MVCDMGLNFQYFFVYILPISYSSLYKINDVRDSKIFRVEIQNMRENKIFLNYILMGKYDYYVVIYDNKYRYIILLNLVFGRENNFSMMLSIGKVRRVKDMVDICLYKNTEVSPKFSNFSFFPSGYIFSSKMSWSILALRVYFFRA